ncbi:hypothetical protein EHS25_003350 [Saitozyma podzolica]|uniref:Uncharacterized protein n=1 Tax=Saitozyma podzolica TaxID=1890683 RepID=A0A427Y8I9_9TREE|nr:hypothetical protein EHS25_003350 [Saitozyma podzolica]
MSTTQGAHADTEASQSVIDWELVEGRTFASEPSPESWTVDYRSMPPIDKNDSSKSLFRYVPSRGDRPSFLVLSSGGLDRLLTIMDAVTSPCLLLTDMSGREVLKCADELGTCYAVHQLRITPPETLQELSGKSLGQVLSRGSEVISLTELEPTIQHFIRKLRAQSDLIAQREAEAARPVLPREWETGGPAQ